MFASAPGLGAATGTTADGFVYTDTGSAITLNGYTGLTGAVTLPDSIVGKPVTAIADLAFFNNAVLTSVTIPSGVTSIGAQAFQGCANLTSLTMQVGVTSFGDYAFQGCGKLASLTIPSSVTSIGYQAFQGCSSLVSVTIPNSVTTLGDAAFAACPSLASVTISSSMTSLGDYLFQYCIGLTTVTIPVSVTHIGTGAFYGCSGLTGVTLPTNLTTLGPQAFAFCSGLTSLTVPSGVTDIGLNTFFECHALTSVTLLGNVTSVGEAAYAFCDHLTSVTLPSGISSIAVSTFYECVALESVTIPSNVTSIGANAFYDCVALTSLTIPAGVTSIGASAFEYCGTLESVLFLGHAPTVGASVFGDAPLSILYYQPAATGWTNPFATRPAYTTPTVTALSPASGPTTGGDALTLTGTGFAGTPGVTVGGVAATSIVVVSDTQITATAPAGSAGARDVAVTTIAGTGSGAGLYTYYKVTPTITWTTPSAITYGAALTAAQLNATASVAGTFAYSPAAGAVPAAGTQTLSVIFTPTDTANYTSANSSVSLVVGKATPTITTAPTASAISYGQTLAVSSLSGGAASVSGSFAFTTPTTAPGAGSAAQAVTFTPTDAANYAVATTTVSVSVNQATPTITWATPSGIGYGVALTATQLNATASVAGTFAYSPAAGAVPAAGTQTLSVTFTPTDATNYTSANSSVSLDVGKVTPTITTAPTASAISYGQTLAASSLSGGAASVSGSFAFTAPTTAPGAGSAAQAVTFTPTDSSNYTVATTTVSVSVNQATPTITWATPSAITYGTALTGTQLNATASVAGTFAYSPAAGAVPAAGTQTLGVTFTPADTANYTVASGSVSLAVGKATSTITWATPPAITYGTALTGTQLNATASVAGTFAYSPAAGAVPAAGTQTLGVTFTPADAANYTAASGSVSLAVGKATPTITWATPSAITYGTALTGTQLNATASVAGTFAYSPAAGAVPAAGTQTLGVTFTPTDATNYTAASGSAALTVGKAVLTVRADDQTRLYGVANPVLTVTYAGFKNGDTSSSLTTAPTVTTTATVACAAGTSALTPSGGVAANYTFSHVAGTLTIVACAPDAPTRVTATLGNGSADVSFRPPANNGGTAVTRYTVTATPVGGGTPLTADGAGAPITIAGLTNGTTYTFTVTATNAAGTSLASAASGALTPAIAPTVAAPTSADLAITTATLGGDVTSDGGADITARGVVFAVAAVNLAPQLGGAGVTDVAAPGTSGIFTVAATGLAPGTAHVFAAYATNGMGTSYSATGTFTTAPAVTVPGAPSGVTLTSGNGSMTVSFTAPSNGGTDITRYTVTATPVGGGPALTATGTGSPITVTGLVNGTRYTFTVAASNGLGTSPVSAPSEPTAPCIPPPPCLLANISVRANLASGQRLIPGVVVAGNKPLLLRAGGPALNQFGLTGLCDPVLQVYSHTGVLMTQNDNWGTELAATCSQLGAFPFAPGSGDSALVTELSGPHTAFAFGPGAGTVLLELYDTATTDCVNRLVNVSARQYVGTGGEPLIVGFVIVGTGSKQLLIRGVGPKLLAYGVPGVLADPYLQVFDACGTQIAANDNWAAGLAATFTQVGAFGLDAGSKDAAVLITLAPGVYTAKLTGVGKVTGEGLLEVYEVWP